MFDQFYVQEENGIFFILAIISTSQCYRNDFKIIILQESYYPTVINNYLQNVKKKTKQKIIPVEFMKLFLKSWEIFVNVIVLYSIQYSIIYAVYRFKNDVLWMVPNTTEMWDKHFNEFPCSYHPDSTLIKICHSSFLLCMRSVYVCVV